MKFYVINHKLSRITITVVANFIVGLYLVFFIAAGIHGVNLLEEWLKAGVWVFVLFTAMITISVIAAIYFTLLCFSVININEQEIVFGTGKLVYNRATWEQVETVALVEVWGKGEHRLAINVTLKGKIELFNTKRTTLNILSKRKICFMFDKKAYSEIKKYYDKSMENEYLRFHYYDNGAPKKE